MAGFKIKDIFPMSTEEIEQAAPWLAGGLPDLERMELSLTRGLIQLRGSTDFNLYDTPVALTVHNDHFSDSLSLVSLDPQSYSSHFLIKAQEPLMDYVGTGTYDLSEAGLRFEQIHAAARNKDLPFAELDSGSNLFGRLGNGLDPYFLAKKIGYAIKDGSSKDYWGRPHKYYMLQENKSRLSEFQDAHSQVYRTASRYLKAFHAFCVGYNLWKCGESPCCKGIPILEQAYLMHQLYKDSNYEPPLLCLASGVPLGGEIIPILDPKSMCLETRKGTVQFPLDGLGDEEEELALWRKFVRPLYMENGQIDLTASLRFMHRDSVKTEIIKENK